MTSDKATAIDVVEASRLSVENKKSSLEELRVQMRGTSKDVTSSYKAYLRSKSKAAAKASARRLSRLSSEEGVLGQAIDAYSAVYKKVCASVDALVNARDSYVTEIHLTGDIKGAKKATRAINSYIKRKEKKISKIDDSVSCILSHYVHAIRPATNQKDIVKSRASSLGAKSSAQHSVPGRASEVEIAPVSIDISETVEHAVERAIAELSAALEQKIAETIAATQLPVTESSDISQLTEAAERIGNAASVLAGTLAELDKVVADVGALADKCRTIVEMQRSTSREMQGIEVKQRLVNQEQTALVEAQEVVLQHQKLISEKHSEITQAQAASVDAVNSIIKSQKQIDSSLRESIKAQKLLLGSKSKYVDKLNKQIADNDSESMEDNNG